MNAYNFETTDFALSDIGIHLLRSRFNYKTIEFEKIENAMIKRGSEINNVFVSLLLGIALAVFAVFQTMYVIGLFKNPSVHQIQAESILLPLLPAFAGFYLIYVATKKSPVLIIKFDGTKKKLRLKDFRKTNKMNDLKNYLKEKLTHRLLIEEDINLLRS